MIVPRTRLLLWITVVVVPFAFLAAVEPAAERFSALAIGLLLALVVVDALRTPARLLDLSIVLPTVARMSKDREAKLAVRIRNLRQEPRTIRLALGLPSEILSPQEEAQVSLPAQNEWSQFAWTCQPCKRGRYVVRSAYLEANSPLGFWSGRRPVAADCEIRVYPNVFQERRELAALFLHRGAFGLHPRRQVGKGREFEKLREYIPGDSFEEIHWKATAKRGHPITKVFQIERTQEIYVILDASRLSARELERPRAGASHGPVNVEAQPLTTLERFVAATLALGLAAEQQGDLFGLVTFTDKVERFVRARNGKAHYGACRDALYTLAPRIVSPDFDEVCTFIRLRLRRRALLLFLTALDDPVLAESFVRNLDLIRRQHLVVVNMIQPPSVAPLFTNPEVASVDDLYRHLGGHLLWQNLRELQKILQRRGVHFALLQNERLSAELISQYLAIKQRQLL